MSLIFTIRLNDQIIYQLILTDNLAYPAIFVNIRKTSEVDVISTSEVFHIRINVGDITSTPRTYYTQSPFYRG